MIWFNHTGPVQPVGSVVGTNTIGGQNYTVWQGSNGQNNVVSYVATTPAPTTTNLNLLPFIASTETLNPAINNTWYMTSIQAGFEPWTAIPGAAVTSFSASVNGVS